MEKSLPEGAAYDSSNFLTKGDRIELSRGYKLLGSVLETSGHNQGLWVAYNNAGEEILYRKRGQKLEYYSPTTLLWNEVGTNIFGADAEDDIASFSNYVSTSGAQLWISSPNSPGLIKIMTANPGSYCIFTSDTEKGYIKILTNRMFMWGLKTDKTGVYLSHIDEQNYNVLTDSIIGWGTGSIKTFSATLSPFGTGYDTIFGVVVKNKDIIYLPDLPSDGNSITITVNGQPIPFTFVNTIGSTPGNILIDQDSGHTTAQKLAITYNNLVSLIQNPGSTTANHIALNTAQQAALLELQITDLWATSLAVHKLIVSNLLSSVTYTVAMSMTSANNVFIAGITETFTDDYSGILTGSNGGTGTIDYTTHAISVTFGSNPTNGTPITVECSYENSAVGGIADFSFSSPRTAGEGDVIRQDSGGEIMNILAYNNNIFCIHKKNTWLLNIASNDLSADNSIYREHVGMSNVLNAYATGDGIYYIDDSEPSTPKLRLLTLDRYIANIIPKSISEQLNIDDYLFDKGCVYEFGDYILFSCRSRKSENNDTVFVYNKKYGSIDKRDFTISCFATYGGKLHGGDSPTGNIFELFSGWTDDESNTPGHWDSGYLSLGYIGMKKVKRIVFEGLICKNQSFDIYTAIDSNSWELLGTVAGNGTYVDVETNQSIIGTEIIGTNVIGGKSEKMEANHYQKEFKVNISKFQYMKFRIVPKGYGYLSLGVVLFEDIRRKGLKQPNKYRAS